MAELWLGNIRCRDEELTTRCIEDATEKVVVKSYI